MDIIDKKIEIIKLYDIYQDLLTEKQKQYLEAYYYDDLSITEISEDYEVSRNAVHDQVTRAVKKLTELENSLKISDKTTKREKIYTKIKSENNIDNIKKLIEELEKVE